jgi:hypothetical protein
MNGVATWDPPAICLVLINYCIPALEIWRELEEGVVLIIDIFLRNLLLDDSLAPIVIKPWVIDFLLVGACAEEGVLDSCDV